MLFFFLDFWVILKRDRTLGKLWSRYRYFACETCGLLWGRGWTAVVRTLPQCLSILYNQIICPFKCWWKLRMWLYPHDYVKCQNGDCSAGPNQGITWAVYKQRVVPGCLSSVWPLFYLCPIPRRNCLLLITQMSLEAGSSLVRPPEEHATSQHFDFTSVWFPGVDQLCFPDFWQTKLWANKWVLLEDTKFMVIYHRAVGEDSWESLGLQGDPTSPY